MNNRSIIFMTAALALIPLGGCSGTDGESGAPGTQGVQGAQGAPGDKGDPGVDGQDGDKGDQGDPGAPASARDSADWIPLFGEAFFPEGVATRADGTIYVGSVTSGEIVRVPPGQIKPEPFVPSGPLGRVGLLINQAKDTLWACSASLAGNPGALQSFDATTGEAKADIPFPGGFCNDLTIDPAGNLYVTDSFGGIIYKLPDGGTTLEPWADDPSFKVEPGAFGLNGIAWDGDHLYVAKTASGSLLRVDVGAGGEAGDVTMIDTGESLVGPDGIKLAAPGTLLVTDNGGSAMQWVKITGESAEVTTLMNGLNTPTTADFDGGDAWVAEGQFGHLFGGDETPPDLPFRLVRVYLP